MKLAQLAERMQVDMPLLVTNVSKGITTSGAPYLNLVLQDNSGTMDGKVWDVPDELDKSVKAGKIYQVRGDVLNYRGTLQMKVTDMVLKQEHLVNLNDFLISSHISSAELRERIYIAIAGIKNEVLRKLVEKLVKKADPEYFSFPAATRNHHEFVGGLATHVCEMLDLGESLCVLFPQLDRDLIIAGIITHDIGKLEELSGALVSEYTTTGKLLGHISIAAGKIQQAAIEMGVADREEVLLLRHMVLSHHGAYEFGSPVLPMTREAEVLAFVDNLDARLNMIDKVLENLEPGEFSQRIFSLENRSFYKPKGE
jgi:3'-5' exoribonuclease